MGLNLDSAPIEILESVSVTRQDLDIHHKALVLHAGGGVILSTCNRTEIYSISSNPDRGLRQLIEYLDILMCRGDKKLNLAPYIYTLTGDDVVRHLFSVTSGLGSPAIGESEVAGQVSNALKVAAENGAVVKRAGVEMDVPLDGIPYGCRETFPVRDIAISGTGNRWNVLDGEAKVGVRPS